MLYALLLALPVLIWNDPQTDVNWRMYRSDTAGGPYQSVAIDLTERRFTAADPGCYVVTAYRGGLESPYSNEYCLDAPAIPPNSPSNLRPEQSAYVLNGTAGVLLGTWSVTGASLRITARGVDITGADDPRIVAKASGRLAGQFSWVFGRYPRGRMRAWLQTTTGRYHAISADGTYLTGSDYEMVFDGSTLKILRDGQEIASVPATGEIVAIDYPIYVGSNAVGGGECCFAVGRIESLEIR